MATSVSLNGVTYSIPAVNDEGWGNNVSSYLIAIAQATLQKTGGSFTLTAEVNFGATYGIKAAYLKSQATNPASAGIIRLGNVEEIAWRNAANSADKTLTVDTSDRLTYGGVNVPTISSTDALTNKTIVAASNTITTAATGNLAAVELNAALAELQTDIDSKGTSISDHIADTTDAHDASAISSVASGNLAATDVQAALNELQTDIDTRAPKASPTFTGTVLLQNAAGAQPELAFSEDPDNGTNKVTVKAPATLAADYTLTLPTDDGGANQVLQTDGSGVLGWATVASTVTTTEGDIIYRGASADERLAGNTAAAPAYLVQLGTGAASAAPTWKKASDYTKIRLQGSSGYGSTNTKIRRFTTAVVNTGTGLTYADSATLGATFTCNVAGVYSFCYSDNFSGAGARFGLSLNSSQLTTDIVSITAADCLIYSSGTYANVPDQVCVTIALAVNDVVRAHTEGVAAGDSAAPKVTMTVQRIL